MYSVYTTRGFVLGSFERGEANRVYSIYTRDFGLVRASAQGVRLEKSKLRYNLDDFANGYFSLVRGKELWRLTGSEREGDMVASVEVRRVVARVLNLVRRLVHGEERNEALYEALDAMMQRARSFPDGGDISALEMLSLLRVLRSLGYVGAVPGIDESAFSGDISDAALASVAGKKADVLAYINRAIEKSQL